MNQNDYVFFNELSTQPLCGGVDGTERILLYSKVLKRCVALGHKKVRYENEFSNIPFSEGVSLSEFCYKNNRNPELNTAINLLLSTQIHPYIEDNTCQENLFIENEYEISIGGESLDGYGLTSAYINHSFAVGFCSSDMWRMEYKFPIQVKQKGGKIDTGEVFCVSRMEHFDEDDFVNWYLLENIPSYQKRDSVGKCHLRDDHGKDVLMEFSKKILKEDFIVEVVNSLPFDPKARKFIEKFDSDGIINIRLTNTDAGYGIAVRTTGKNKIQISYFAKYINEKYGK